MTLVLHRFVKADGWRCAHPDPAGANLPAIAAKPWERNEVDGRVRSQVQSLRF